MRSRISLLILLWPLLSLMSCGKSGEKEASAPRIENITIESVGPDRIVVFWSTSIPTDGEIAVGTTRETLSRTIPVPAITTLHRTPLEGLEPGTTYFFQVKARAGNQEALSDVVETATAAAQTATAQEQATYDVAVIKTTLGEIVFRLNDQDAPRHTANFRKLARQGFYDGTTFHRVIPGFMIQGGDPNSKDNDRENDGTGGPGYTIPAEIKALHLRGAVSAARQADQVNPERRSSGSQFFICVAPQTFLDGAYSVFGNVVRGMEVVDKIVSVPRDARDNPLTPVVIRSVTIRTVRAGEQP